MSLTNFNSDKYLITSIKSNYFIASNLSHNIQVYTVDELDYGDVIKVEDTALKPLNTSLSTYGYNSDYYFKENNLKNRTEEYKLIKHLPNISSFIHSKIRKIEDDSTRTVLNKLIFNITDYELLNDFILESGLNYFGISLVLISFFRYFFKESFTKLLTNLALLIYLLINPCFQGFRFIIYRLISANSKNKYKNFGIMTLIVMMLFPHKVTSISFLFPTAIRLFALIKRKDSSFLTLIIFLNSYFFNQVNIIKTLLFRTFSIFNGLFTILVLVTLPISNLSNYLAYLYLSITNFLDKFDFTIYGHAGIITLTLYILLIKSFKKFKYQDLIIMSLLIILNVNNLYGSISFINVGHGDATLIKTPLFKETILIDTGSETNYYRLDNYLKGKGVKKIDYLVLTHNDEDHSGNVENLVSDYKIKNIITSKEDVTANNLKLLQLNTNSFKEENTNSNCYYSKINGLTYLFTGDIDLEAESAILKEFNNLDIDILKVAHHGSKTSSSKEFIKTISPLISIISCSNKYNFPAKETLDTLTNNKSLILLTKKVGDIEIINLLGFNLLKTSNHKFSILH